MFSLVKLILQLRVYNNILAKKQDWDVLLLYWQKKRLFKV